MPKLRFWQSREKTLRVLETGFDILKVLSRVHEPQSVSDLLERMGHSQYGVQSGYVNNALRVLHKAGHIEADGKVSWARLSADMTKVSITPSGRDVLKESRTRLRFAERMLQAS